MITRLGRPSDARAMATIYNEGIADRVATFEVRPRETNEVEAWFDGAHPIIVVEEDGTVIAFAATSPYRPRACYDGVAETMVYVRRSARKRGAGRLVLEQLIAEAERTGFWKLVARIFPENEASLALVRALGFRQVGVYEKHGKLDGVWRDVVVVERLIPSNLD